MQSFLILGGGYTGALVARSLAAEGHRVTCTNRRPASIPGVRCLALDVTNRQSIADAAFQVEAGSKILYSVPGVQPHESLLPVIRSWHPQRMVYLSTTGVYGATEWVEESTPPNPQEMRDVLRLRTEEMLADGPWSTLVLRPAGIYGPDRGVHVAVRDDDYSRIGTWNRMVSRIHVDDLASHCKTALMNELQGQYPVADEEPCRSIEVAAFAAQILGKTLPDLPAGELGGRRVDGSAVRTQLGLNLRFRSYRDGVAEALGRLELS